MERTLDRNGRRLKIGDNVIWFHPEKSVRDLGRVWKVDHIEEGKVEIKDCFSHEEAFSADLEKII